jgi:hypothetical protein
MSAEDKDFGVYGVRVRGVGDAWQFMKIGMTGDWEMRKSGLSQCVKPFMGWGEVVLRFGSRRTRRLTPAGLSASFTVR